MMKYQQEPLGTPQNASFMKRLGLPPSFSDSNHRLLPIVADLDRLKVSLSLPEIIYQEAEEFVKRWLAQKEVRARIPSHLLACVCIYYASRTHSSPYFDLPRLESALVGLGFEVREKELFHVVYLMAPVFGYVEPVNVHDYLAILTRRIASELEGKPEAKAVQPVYIRALELAENSTPGKSPRVLASTYLARADSSLGGVVGIERIARAGRIRPARLRMYANQGCFESFIKPDGHSRGERER